MKKIFTLLMLTISISGWAQWSNTAISPSAASELHPGTTVNVTGNFLTTHAIAGAATKITMNITTRITDDWSAGGLISSEEVTIFENGDAGLTTGAIDHNITIPNNFPLKADGNYMQYVQVRAQYNTTWVNNFAAWISVTEGTTTDIDSPLAIGSVYVTGSTLNIKDASAKTFEIFNLSGTVVEAGSINGSSVQIPLSLAKGIYIVKVGNTTTKISL